MSKGGSSRGTGQVAGSPFLQRVDHQLPVADRDLELLRAVEARPAQPLARARLLQDVPEPRLHQVRYYGRYANVARAQRNAPSGEPEREAEQGLGSSSPSDAEPDAAERRRLRRLWAPLIRQVYEVDPLLCHGCGGSKRILAFILEPGAVPKILAHVAAKGAGSGRALPSLEPIPSSLAT